MTVGKRKIPPMQYMITVDNIMDISEGHWAYVRPKNRIVYGFIMKTSPPSTGLNLKPIKTSIVKTNLTISDARL